MSDRTRGLKQAMPGVPVEWVERLVTSDDNTDQVPSIFVEAGYGSVSLATQGVSGDAIGAGWVDLDDASVITVTGKNCTMNPSGSGTFSFGKPGVWVVSLYVAVAHEEDNAGRETFFRGFNITEGSPESSNVYPVFIARNQPGSSISVSFQFSIVEEDLGDIFKIQIGGGDTIALPVYDAQNINLAKISEV